MLIRHVRAREDHQWLHLHLPCGECPARVAARSSASSAISDARKRFSPAKDLDRLAASVGRFTERAMVLDAINNGDVARYEARRIGGPLLFGRLWQQLASIR